MIPTTTISLPRQTFDILKILAALLVIIAHMASFAITKYGSNNPVFFAAASQSGYIGVAVFFFLSGFGLMESEQKNHLNLKQFLRRRILKVYLPVVLVTVIWIGLLYTFNPSFSGIYLTNLRGTLDYVSLIYTFMWGFADPVMWYIRVLIPLYALFFIATVIGHKSHYKLCIYILAVICVAYSIGASIINDGIQKHSVPLFALGAIASVIKNNRYAVLKFSGITLLTGLIVSCASLATSHPITGFVHSFFDYVVIILIVAIISFKSFDIKAPVLLSAITFDIYLIHFKVLEFAADSMTLTLFLILSIPLSAVISHLFLRVRSVLIHL